MQYVVLRSPLVRLLACMALLGSLICCGVVEPDKKFQLTLYVASTMVECEGVGPQQCLRVKEHPDDAWSNFYGSIDGFTYEPRYTYTLLVEWRPVPDPPADSSSREYRLIRIVAQKASPPS